MHEMRTIRVDRIEEARMLADASMPDGEENRVAGGWLKAGNAASDQFCI